MFVLKNMNILEHEIKVTFLSQIIKAVDTKHERIKCPDSIHSRPNATLNSATTVRAFSPNSVIRKHATNQLLVRPQKKGNPNKVKE